MGKATIGLSFKEDRKSLKVKYFNLLTHLPKTLSPTLKNESTAHSISPMDSYQVQLAAFCAVEKLNKV